jgi:hypothetical protein
MLIKVWFINLRIRKEVPLEEPLKRLARMVSGPIHLAA